MANRRIHEANDPIVEHEDRFVYINEAPLSLQELAADEIARSIWHSNLTTYHPIKKEEPNVIWLHDLLEHCDEQGYQQHQTKRMINYLKLPRIVGEKLENSLKGIRKQIRDWVVHLLQIVFNYKCLRERHEIRGVDPRWCVWRANGRIDYEHSARKIIEMGNLSNLQKFLIMCEYCFEDEIKKFSLDLLPSEFIDKVKFTTHRSCFYWIHYLKNDLDKMPFENPLLADLQTRFTVVYGSNFSSIDHYDYYRFSNIFFWHRLNDDDQVRIVSIWIRRSFPSEYMLLDRIVSQMSWYQQQRLLSEMTEQNILNFITYYTSPRFALWIWKHLKDKTPAEGFMKMFCELIFSKITTCTLVEIWQTASDHQRNYFIANMSKEFIYSVIREDSDISCSLIDGLMNERRNLYDKSLLNNMFGSPSPDCDDHLIVIKLIIDSYRFLKHLDLTHCYQNPKKLDDELKSYFLNDDNAAREYKRLYLTRTDPNFNIDTVRLVTNVNLWNEFCKHLDEACDYDLERTSQVKETILSSLAEDLFAHQAHSVVAEPQYYLDLRNGFYDLVKIFEMVFEDNDELRGQKRDFYYAFRNYKSTHAFANIDHEFKLKLKRWCVGLKKKKCIPK